MKGIVYGATALALLSLGAVAQVFQDAPRGARRQRQRPQAESRFDGLFYKAYYLQHGARNLRAAAPIYREYLAKTEGKGRFVQKAAGYLGTILRRQGQPEAAAELAKRYGAADGGNREQRRALEARARELTAQLRSLQSAEGVDPAKVEALKKALAELKAKLQANRPKVDRAAWIKQTEERLRRTKERLQEMEESGTNERRLAMMKRLVKQQEEMLAKVKKGEMEPPQRRNMRGRNRFDLSTMSPEMRKRSLDRMMNFARMQLNRLKESGNAEQAASLEAKIKEVEGYIKAEDWKKVNETIRQLMQRRGGRRGAEGRRGGEGRRGFGGGGEGQPRRRRRPGGEGGGGF